MRSGRKVTIVARGMMGGYTVALPTRTGFFKTKAEFEDKLAVFWPATSPRRLVFEEQSTGASQRYREGDRARAPDGDRVRDERQPRSARLREEGRAGFLGREISEQRNYSDEIAKTIDEEVRAIIDKAFERATEVLTVHRDKLLALAEKLVAEETVDSEAFEALFSDLPPKADMHGIPMIVGPGQPIPEPTAQPA